MSSAPGLFRPPPPQNEPVKDYAPGTPEREELRVRLEQLRSDQIELPLVIGGEEVRTRETFDAVMPHDKNHVLAKVHKGGASHVDRAIKAAADAWQDWHRTPWEDRAAVFLRAAELLTGPWRSTLNGATMLGQSKTAHQAEIDAACELADFFRFNVQFMLRIYEEQPSSAPGTWNRMEYRPLEGFVFAVTPFNFTAIAGNLPTSAALMGNTVVWKPASTAAYSAHFLMQLYEAAGLPPGVINLVYGSGSEIGDPVLASSDLAGVHFTGSTPVFQSMWKTIGANIASYRNYPRIVGETGGKDFTVAHPSADAAAVATAIVRGSFEYQGQKCSAASRIFAPSNLWPEIRDRLVEDVGSIKMGDVADFQNFMGAVIDAGSFKTQKQAIDEARAADKVKVLVGGGYDDSDGYFVEPTVLETTDPSFRTMQEELSGRQVRRNARADRPGRTVRIDRSGVCPRARSARARGREAPLYGGELLRERQADRRGRGPATVRRCPGLGDERQGGIDVEPDSLGEPTHDQGDLRAASRLPLSVHGARRRPRRELRQ
jgi:1-pyrroline-5-carboxylate dehydrogenase